MAFQSISVLSGFIHKALGNENNINIKFTEDPSGVKVSIDFIIADHYFENATFKDFTKETTWEKGEIELPINIDLGRIAPEMIITAQGSNDIILNVKAKLPAGQNLARKKWQPGGEGEKNKWQAS